MDCRLCWYVQSTEDGTFLAPDGEGGVVTFSLLADAVPFYSREAAFHAAVDHFDGKASVIRFRMLYEDEEGECTDEN